MENISISTTKANTASELAKEIARLRAENEALKLKAYSAKSLTCKVSTKGAVSIYGFGRFPVTLYKEQWLRLIDFAPALKSFIEANESQLSVK